MPRTVLHMANLRLGTTLPALGYHGREHRSQMVATLGTLADLVRMERVAAVLISGDLFDCAIPAPQTLSAVRSFFSRLKLAGIPCVVLPGERDPDGIFLRRREIEADTLCPGVHVLGPQHQPVCLEAQGLAVWYAAGDDADHLPLPNGRHRLVDLALGYQRDGSAEALDARARRIAPDGVRYLGVGGSTGFTLLDHGDVLACMPGVPEPFDWNQEGSVALLHIADDGSVRVERRRTGSHAFVRRELVVTPENAHRIGEIIGKMGRADLALEIVLVGGCPLTAMLEPTFIESELGRHFFHLRVVDRTALLHTEATERLREEPSIAGNFARVMERRMQDTDANPQATFDREAYRLGMRLLQGDRIDR